MKTTIAIVAMFALFVVAGPALACEEPGCFGDDEVKIKVQNSGTVVTNQLSVKANSGKNDADGGAGGNGGKGGRGGDMAGDGGDGGYAKYGHFTAQTGGNGGDGGDTGDGGAGGDGGNGAAGGTITTGDADAQGWITNTVNSTDIEVDDCACDETDPLALLGAFADETLKVKVDNSGTNVGNQAQVKANTGKNDADGGDGGRGGRGGRGGNDAGDGGAGGDAEGDQTDCGCECGGCDIPWYLLLDSDVTQTGGDGGNGGDTGSGGDGGWGWHGGAGGTIDTGASTSYGDILNDVNSTIIRVRR